MKDMLSSKVEECISEKIYTTELDIDKEIRVHEEILDAYELMQKVGIQMQIKFMVWFIFINGFSNSKLHIHQIPITISGARRVTGILESEIQRMVGRFRWQNSLTKKWKGTADSKNWEDKTLGK